MFTQGKYRYYERLMQEKPNWDRQMSKRRNSIEYKYKYTDLDCRYCHCVSKDNGTCKHSLCPHIVDNIRDLVSDSDFINAIHCADSCTTYQRYTLMYLKDYI
jgi:hypothetical protein